MPILPSSNVLNLSQCWQRLEQAAIPAVKSTMDVLPCRNVKFKMLLTSFSPKSTDWLGISIFIPTAKFWCFHGDIQRDATRTSKNWYITRWKCLYMRTNWLKTIRNIKTSSSYYFVTDSVQTQCYKEEKKTLYVMSQIEDKPLKRCAQCFREYTEVKR